MSRTSLKIFLFAMIISQIKDISIPQKDNFFHNKNITFPQNNINYPSKNFLGQLLKDNNTIEWDIELTKKLDQLIFYISFSIITIFSLILIFIDIEEDKKIINFYNFTNIKKADYIYQKYKKIKNKKVLRFALQLAKYHHPIGNILTMYDFNHPRYIRFLIEIIKIQLYLLISPLFFVCTNNIYVQFLYSLIVSFILYIFTEIITIEFRKIRKNIWKPRLEYLRKYVYYNIKKDVLFNSKWQSVKKRLVTYCRVCGDSILINKPQDKYEIYMQDKKYNNNSRSFVNLSKSNEGKLPSMQNYKESRNESLTELSLFYGKMSDENSIFFTNISNHNKNEYKNRNKTSSTSSKTEDNFVIDYSINPFAISKHGQNRLPLKKVLKIEDIRNKYILNKTEIKYDQTVDIYDIEKIFKNLEIESLDNYTFISNFTVINYLRSSNNDSYKIMKNILINLLFLCILIIVNFLLICVLKNIENKLNWHYWYILIFVQLILVNFLAHFVLCLFISFMLFHYYGKHKKNYMIKMFFKIFVEKYMRYLFKIKLLIQKYDKEFQFIK